MKLNNAQATDIVAQEKAERNTFADTLRHFEQAFTSGKDYGTELLTLSEAVARSTVKKFADPQRKTAVNRDAVSNGGQSPAMLEMLHGIGADHRLLENTRNAANAATACERNDDGEYVTKVVDKDADKACNALIRETLSDGIDLVNEAAAAVLEEAAKAMERGEDMGNGWLERTYTKRKLAKHVLIRLEESAAWKDEDTTPIQEVFQACNKLVAVARASKADPSSKFVYVEDFATNDEGGLETIYRRMGKCSDIGGYAVDGYTGRVSTLYTAGIAEAEQYADAYDRIVGALNLTARQAQIVELRMRGYGYEAIATHLGVKKQGILIQLKRIAEKCEKMGFMPA